jgi:transposase
MAESIHHFQNNKEDFLKHYHKRSNVETTFMAIKQKFGETLKSKNTTAQVNELLCKIIAYNITVLISSMYTRKIDVKFSGQSPVSASV